LYLQELRQFRSTLSGEQWQQWLNFARAEKKRLIAESKAKVEPESLPTGKKIPLNVVEAIERVRANATNQYLNDNRQQQQQPIDNKGRKSLPNNGNNLDQLGESANSIDPQRRSIPPSLGQLPPPSSSYHQQQHIPLSSHDTSFVETSFNNSNGDVLNSFGVSTEKPNALRSRSAPRQRSTLPSETKATPMGSSLFSSSASFSSSSSSSQFQPNKLMQIPQSTNAGNQQHIPVKTMPPSYRSPIHLDQLKSPRSSALYSDLLREVWLAQQQPEKQHSPQLGSSKQQVESNQETSTSIPTNNHHTNVEDLRNALETAQIGSNRIETACTAARYLLNSLSAISGHADQHLSER
jgi:hypothetical protein